MQSTDFKLCIPRITSDINYGFIKFVFEKLNIGTIKTIRIFASKTGEKKVIIDYKNWNESTRAKSIKTRLDNEEPVNIMYQTPWFWKIKYAY